MKTQQAEAADVMAAFLLRSCILFSDRKSIQLLTDCSQDLAARARELRTVDSHLRGNDRIQARAA